MHETIREPATLLDLAPARIQRRRLRGWRMPQGAIFVGRPTRYGNPFTIEEYGRVQAVRLFRMYAEDTRRGWDWLEPLRGHDLACWCALGVPCHADILLELANR